VPSAVLDPSERLSPACQRNAEPAWPESNARELLEAAAVAKNPVADEAAALDRLATRRWARDVDWAWHNTKNVGSGRPQDTALKQEPVFSICARIRTFGVLRGYCRTMGPRAIFGAVNLAEMPGPGNGLMRTQVLRVATTGKLLRSCQMTHSPRARNFLALQSSRLQSSKEENHRDSMMIEANSSILNCLLRLFYFIAFSAFGRDLASCA
jgi:hypothetical protein